jgi:glutathione S-transferase
MERGAVRFVIKTFDGGLSSLYGVLMNKDPSLDTDKIKAALTFLREIESIFEKQSAGPFFLGDRFSLADISLVPFVFRFSVLLPFYRGVDLLNVVSLLSPSVSPIASLVVLCFGSMPPGGRELPTVENTAGRIEDPAWFRQDCPAS